MESMDAELNGLKHLSAGKTTGIKVAAPKDSAALAPDDVGLVTPGSIRLKDPPKCEAPSLKREAQTTEELAKYTFSSSLSAALKAAEKEKSAIAVPESSSSSAGSSMENQTHTSGSTGISNDEKLKDMQRRMLSMKKSRQGRESQRWLTDEESQQRVRLTTGCVPILKGGRILFVSSSRKPEWILPKGGWEEDENMEESAIREAYEEAGVLGFLGPALTPIQYESRKSKKRRKELEELRRSNSEKTVGQEYDASSRLPAVATPSVDGSPGSTSHCNDAMMVEQGTGTFLPDALMDRLRGSHLEFRSDDASSTASESYALARLTLFPLYVTEVRSNWPESGRFRKAVHIDEAIEMLSSREEFLSALIEVKKKNLHLVSGTPSA
jgi:diphosphoinositol-polyphosphate diphosphatase